MVALVALVLISASPADRCGKIFEGIRPALDKKWAASMGADQLAAAKRDLPKLRDAFISECVRLPEPDLVCGEKNLPPDPVMTCGTLAPSARPACLKELRLNPKTSPLGCRAISDALGRAQHPHSDAGESK